jgi:hypothetical protein
MKKLLTFLTIAVALSGCKTFEKLKATTSVSVSTPSITQPVELIFKIWDMENTIKSVVPDNSKFGKFLDESSKYCTIKLTKYPADGNDTAEVRIKCKTDSLTNLVAGKLGL